MTELKKWTKKWKASWEMVEGRRQAARGLPGRNLESLKAVFFFLNLMNRDYASSSVLKLAKEEIGKEDYGEISHV